MTTPWYTEPGTLFGVMGAGFTFIYFLFNYRYKRGVDVKEIARNVKKEAENIAEKLENERLTRAAKEKRDIQDYIDLKTTEIVNERKHIILELVSDIKHDNEMMQTKLDAINIAILTVVKDFSKYGKLTDATIEKIEQKLELMSQMTWGISAKSTAPYLEGLDETQEHKEEDTVGIFKDTEEEQKEKEKD
jgi:hypothetical protein